MPQAQPRHHGGSISSHASATQSPHSYSLRAESANHSRCASARRPTKPQLTSTVN
eukprot:CAMPEP_0206833040 /NCGR_PEP_ID=MMETSP0975-20121206/18193_1 /ASSEMBLY_ACC=CAM_ASM_000399 /TAXON_ID=483370 /ORGANISM="non described non described, Strain CCMP2097" /LENGTH=54 /DNA_ID=CAMNT_0054375431 /DNA_START=39 /DNA_END=200 /DNA_ORIENTATION=-